MGERRVHTRLGTSLRVGLEYERPQAIQHDTLESGAAAFLLARSILFPMAAFHPYSRHSQNKSADAGSRSSMAFGR